MSEEADGRMLELADEFARASIGGNMRRAARMLEQTPELAGYSVTTAVLLGDEERVRAELQRDPELATRPDPRSGWTALHAACSSRWPQLEPARADGLAAIVRLLLDAGADPAAPTPSRPGRGSGMRPLRCAIAVSNSGRSNRQVVELLLERGVVPDDHDLYLAGFAHDRHELLPLLVAHSPVAEIAEQALAAPISNGDTESVRVLLAAGADPRRYRDDDGRPAPVVPAAIEARCDEDLVALLLEHGADPEAAGPDGRTPYQLATAAGRSELAGLIRRHGAADTATPADRFLSACRRADRADARQLLDGDPDLLERLTGDERAAIVLAAEAGDTAAVELMLDLGFAAETRGDDGGTALHAAAYNGSAATVRLLLERGADLEARDTTWNSTPLEWAAVGSGERPRTNAAAAWPETVRMLLERGASAAGITLGPDEAKRPSAEVEELLRLAQRGS
jgi:ankyrin repeat protein